MVRREFRLLGWFLICWCASTLCLGFSITALQLCARPPPAASEDNTSLCTQAGNAHQRVVATLYDLLFSPWAVTRTEQRLVEVERGILKTVLSTNTDISWSEVRRQYIESIYKSGLGINGFVSGVFTLKQALDILRTTAGDTCWFITLLRP